MILLQLLEMRLDVICFNLGFANTIQGARQLVNHGHIRVNNKQVNIPSFQCRINDVITVQEKSKKLIENNFKTNQRLTQFAHLKFDASKFEGKLTNYCDRKDILLNLDELLVVEYYSRR